MLNDDQLFEARQLWSDGWNTARIARRLKVAEHLVYNSIQALKARSNNPAKVVAALRLLNPAHEGSPRSVIRNLDDGARSCRTEKEGNLIGSVGAK